MLIDHAQPERVRGARIGDRLLAAVDQDRALIGLVVAHDALDQRALAGAVLAEQRVKAAGATFIVTASSATKSPKRLVIATASTPSPHCADRSRHWMPPMNAAESETAPKTPPCILIILIA